MSATFKARPTEYKGIRYRSKCEAMFARWLELWLEDQEKPFRNSHYSFGEGAGGFMYEPECLFPRRTIDFLVWQVLCSNIPEPVTWIIEYKPSRPTKTYCEEFASDVREFVGYQEGRAGKTTPMGCLVYYGSHWNTDRGTVGLGGVRADPWGTLEWDETDWFAKYENQVLETRFDLEV